MFKPVFLFVLLLVTAAYAWDGVKFRVRAATDRRFFTGVYVGDRNVSWAPTTGSGKETVHELSSDACGGRLVLFVGHQPTQADEYTIPANCSGKEYRLEVVEKEDGSLKLVLRRIL